VAPVLGDEIGWEGVAVVRLAFDGFGDDRDAEFAEVRQPAPVVQTGDVRTGEVYGGGTPPNQVLKRSACGGIIPKLEDLVPHNLGEIRWGKKRK